LHSGAVPALNFNRQNVPAYLLYAPLKAKAMDFLPAGAEKRSAKAHAVSDFSILCNIFNTNQ